MLHKLCAIAKTKYRYTKFEKFFSTCWRAIFITAVRTTRKDNSFRVHGLNLRQVCLVRIDLTIYITFTDTARNQLVVLTTEVNDNNFLLIHDQSPILCIYIYIIVKLATYDKP